jgi:hypothetical protein
MISARPLELKIHQKKNRNKNNWSDFSVAYLEISHRKESENHGLDGKLTFSTLATDTVALLTR